MSDLVPPVVAAVLAETPADHDGYRLIDIYPSATDEFGQVTVSGVEFGDGAPIAARQAVAVLRYLAENSHTIASASTVWHWLTSEADEIEAQYVTIEGVEK